MTTNRKANTAASDLARLDLDGLQRLRAIAAFEVDDGDTAALSILEDIEAELHRRDLDSERAALAAAEMARRDTAAADAEAAEQRAHVERRLTELGIQRQEALRLIEAGTAALADTVRHALTVDLDMQGVAASLGRSPSQRTPAAIAAYINWRLGRDLGDGEAGLTDMQFVVAGLRSPLSGGLI
jgi:hypothetical protein